MARSAAAVWTVQVALGVVAVCGIAGATTLGWGTGDAPGPGMFPGLASVVLLVFTVAGIARRLRGTPVAAVGVGHADEHEGSNVPRLVAYVAALLLAAFTFRTLGYPLSAALALLVMLVAGERVAIGRAVLITVLAVSATCALFALLLDVPLPMLPTFAGGLR